MNDNDGEYVLMRIFLDEGARDGDRPLYTAIVQEFERFGFSGATVLKGIEGFGSDRQVHAARSFDFSSDLPVLIEIIERAAKLAQALPRLREMISDGLITTERIAVIPVGAGA